MLFGLDYLNINLNEFFLKVTIYIKTIQIGESNV